MRFPVLLLDWRRLAHSLGPHSRATSRSEEMFFLQIFPLGETKFKNRVNLNSCCLGAQIPLAGINRECVPDHGWPQVSVFRGVRLKNPPVDNQPKKNAEPKTAKGRLFGLPGEWPGAAADTHA